MRKPDAVFEKITDIPMDFFKEKNVKGVILDVDNTLITLDEDMLDGLEKWVSDLKRSDIKVCIASNSFKKRKLDEVSKKLNLKYTRLSLKPLKCGLKKALAIIKTKPEETCEIGDQYFTDVIGAKRMNMISILTKPLSPEKHSINKLKRKIEKHYIDKFQK